MFYTANKIITYPYKSIIEDVLSRGSLATVHDFTPFPGMNDLLKKQRIQAGYTLKELINGRPEFSLAKLRDTQSEFLIDYEMTHGAIESERLEDIPEEFIEKYINEVLIGFKLDRTGKKQIEEDDRTFDYFFSEGDDGEDELVSPTDLLEIEVQASAEDISAAKQKLPYLLKVLWDGSLKYCGNLISFIIARSKLLRDGYTDIGPTDYCRYPVFQLDVNGACVGQFEPSANTSDKYRNIIKWLHNKQEKDRYYEAYIELLDCCTILDIDLADENPEDYNGKFISSAVCTYLMSNLEYVNGYGNIDRKLFNALSKDELFKVTEALDVTDKYDAEVSIVKDGTSIIVDEVGFLETLALNWKLMMSKEEWLQNKLDREDFSSIRAYFKELCPDADDSAINGVMKASTSRNYIMCNRKDESYIKISLRPISNVIGVLTVTGQILAIKDTITNSERPYIIWCNVEDFINAKRAGKSIEWKYYYL